MLLIALLASSDAEACAMSYGGGLYVGAGTYGGVSITSSLDEALAAIELTPAERFESLAPKIEDPAPEAPPERAAPTS